MTFVILVDGNIITGFSIVKKGCINVVTKGGNYRWIALSKNNWFGVASLFA